MDDCIFCKIINKTLESKIIFEDENLIAFPDLNPQAPTHILIIPKKHIATLNDANTKHQELLGYMLLTAAKIAKSHNIHDDGYRVLFNTNYGGGQSVYHIHLHLLGGRQMHWPPG